MRQTNIITVYLSSEEFKEAIVKFVGDRRPELAEHISAHAIQLAMHDDQLVIRVASEIDVYNDNEEYIVNE